jgi:hypothetical protein
MRVNCVCLTDSREIEREREDPIRLMVGCQLVLIMASTFGSTKTGQL